MDEFALRENQRHSVDFVETKNTVGINHIHIDTLLLFNNSRNHHYQFSFHPQQEHTMMPEIVHESTYNQNII